MHLVYKALQHHAIPSALPRELQKPPKVDNNDFGAEFVANFPTDIVPVAPVIPPSRPPAPALQPMNMTPLIPAIPSGKGEWVLTTIEKLKYQEIFEKSDLDKDGLVSGAEIKDVFLKSDLPQNMLAHIWALCDTNQSGKLNSEQFALACWLIDRKKKGVDPPQVLAPEMIPPSMRPNAVVVPQVSHEWNEPSDFIFNSKFHFKAHQADLHQPRVGDDFEGDRRAGEGAPRDRSWRCSEGSGHPHQDGWNAKLTERAGHADGDVEAARDAARRGAEAAGRLEGSGLLIFFPSCMKLFIFHDEETGSRRVGQVGKWGSEANQGSGWFRPVKRSAQCCK